MGFHKNEAIEGQESNKCPECGTEVEPNDTGGGYSCPNTDCEQSYEDFCEVCSAPLKEGICRKCHSDKVSSPNT